MPSVHHRGATPAIEDGGPATAKDESNSAGDWVEAAFEDTAGSEREAVDAFAKDVGVALADFGTEQGKQGLAAAEEACA
jgi:hypothetical protein